MGNNFIAYKFEVTQQLTTYFVGSFSLIIQGDYELVWLAVPLVILAFLFANYFNIVGMGRDFSQNLGVNYNLVLFLGLTIWGRFHGFLITAILSLLAVPAFYPVFKAIGKIGGQLWKD